MINYSTLPNTTGSFPNVEGENATGPGATDGTPFVKQFIDDLWGARQALMDRAGLVPNAVQETPGASQFLDALAVVIRKSDVRAQNWRRYTENPTTTDSFEDFAYADQISGAEDQLWIGVGQKNANSGIWGSRGGNGRWTERSHSLTVGTFYAVVWDPINGLFVAVGDNAGSDAAIATSPDGDTWTERANPKDFSLRGIAVNSSGLFVAVGDPDGTDAYIVSSSDGITWTERANPKNFRLRWVTWSETLGLFIAIGDSDGSDTYLITSPDGITWTERANPKNVAFRAVAAGDSMVVAGTNTGDYMRSADGITWTALTLPWGTEGVDSLKWSDELKLFVAPSRIGIDNSGIAVAFSPDGINWEYRFIGIDSNTTDFSVYGLGVGKHNMIIGGISGSIGFSQNW